MNEKFIPRHLLYGRHHNEYTQCDYGCVQRQKRSDRLCGRPKKKKKKSRAEARQFARRSLTFLQQMGPLKRDRLAVASPATRDIFCITMPEEVSVYTLFIIYCRNTLYLR